MLDLNYPSQDHSYFQEISMDPSIRCAPGSFKVDEQTAFGTYSPFLSDPIPFFINPSAFPASPSQLTTKNTSYSNPSTSPSITASHPGLLSSSSSVSARSASSAASSCIGSPNQDPWPDMGSAPGFDENLTITDGLYSHNYLSAGLDANAFLTQDKIADCFVDPSLIQSVQQTNNYQFPAISYPDELQYSFNPSPIFPTTTTPVLTPTHGNPQPQQFQPGLNQMTEQQFPPRQKRKAETSPSMPHFPTELQSFTRRSSISSVRSRPSATSPHLGNIELEDETKEKGRCPHPNCGKVFKDLKAHMLTHQSERPEKCPIVNCEYHLKGFARKYDKNRHTLTHYKGTMVCGFCPGSGSAAEKSFNRADVFKRHLTSVHGVDQSAPNGRKKTPPTSVAKPVGYCQEATGKCSTCTATFSSAQEFYEHLDDCVLRVVQQEEPSEAINMRHLAEVAGDEAVKQTMKKHMLVDTAPTNTLDGIENEDESRDGKSVAQSSLSKNRFLPPQSGGISKPRPSASRRRNNRNNYPPSWGCPTNKMKMKRRLLCLYDGPRRLWKDEMMLDNEFEVRLQLPGGDGMGREAYITDLDVETLKRAEGVLNATDEEKGPWDPATAGHGLIGPAAVPVLGNNNDIVDEINIDELMS